jgi:hypothetical protein
MKTPMDFANLYIEERISLPILFDRKSPFNRRQLNIARLEGSYEAAIELKDKGKKQYYGTQLKEEILNFINLNKLDALNAFKLKPVTEYRIYIALHELFQAVIASSKSTLKNLNREMNNQRKKVINHLEKALAVNFPLLKSERESLLKILDRLKEYDKEKGTYHPIKAVEYHREMIEPSVLMSVLGDKISYKPHVEIMERLLFTPLKVTEGRPRKFFYKALQIIVFKYLHDESNISIEKAKHLTVKIINGYRTKQGYSNIPSLDYKDIDNALSS